MRAVSYPRMLRVAIIGSLAKVISGPRSATGLNKDLSSMVQECIVPSQMPELEIYCAEKFDASRRETIVCVCA